MFGMMRVRARVLTHCDDMIFESSGVSWDSAYDVIYESPGSGWLRNVIERPFTLALRGEMTVRREGPSLR